MNPGRACDYTGIFARIARVFQILPGIIGVKARSPGGIV